jgi:hypothetical protein
VPQLRELEPGHLARLGVALNDDGNLSLASRQARDSAMRDAFPAGVDDIERLSYWLDHVDPDGLRLCHEVTAVVRRIGSLMVLIGLIAGWLGVLGAFYYDGTARVNVPAVAGALVGVPLVALVLSWVGALTGGGQLGSLFAGPAGNISRLGAGRIGSWLQRFFTGDGRRGIEHLFNAPEPGYESVRRWMFVRWSHTAATAFFVAALVTAMTMVVFTDLAFGWSTTLDVQARSVHALAVAMASPWATFWPAAVPDADLVESSRFFRLGAPRESTDAAVALGQWWMFLVATLVTYGLVPRVISLMIARLRVSSAVRSALTETTQARALLQRLKAPRVETARADSTQELSSAQPSGSGTESPVLLSTGSAGAGSVVNWSAVPISDASLAQLFGVSEIAHAGSGLDLAREEVLVDSLVKLGGPVRVVVKAWEPPVLDLVDFLESIDERGKCVVEVFPVRVREGAQAPATPDDMQVWTLALESCKAALVTLKS